MIKKRKFLFFAAFCIASFFTLDYFGFVKNPNARTPEQALKMIKSVPNLVVIDVRPNSFYNQRHYKKAMSIPLTEISQRFVEVPMGRPILLYCQFGISVKEASFLLRKARPDLKEVYFIDAPPIFDDDITTKTIEASDIQENVNI